MHERDIKLPTINGAEYKLISGNFKGVVRLFQKESKSTLQIFLFGALNVQEGDSRVYEFFSSLDFGKPKVESTAKKQGKAEQTP